MVTNIRSAFDELFAEEELCSVASSIGGNTLEAARTKVVRSLQESKMVFLDRNHTYLKHGRAQRPVPCFARRFDGKYVVKVLFSRVTLDLPSGDNGIVCSSDRVPEIHDKLIQFVKGG
jgi:hypothetical protein